MAGFGVLHTAPIKRSLNVLVHFTAFVIIWLSIVDNFATAKFLPQSNPATSVVIWQGWQDLNLRMTESKSVALPLGDTPIKLCGAGDGNRTHDLKDHNLAL